MNSQNDKNRFPWINMLGLAILIICYVGALVNLQRRKHSEATQNVVRIAHWQLELGVRDGLAELIKRFEAKKAAEGQPIKIVQIPITERVYQQYCTTQMIGETAPDMIQIGLNSFPPEEFLGRYFIPLSKSVQDKNPILAERYAELQAQEIKSEQEQYFEEVYERLKDLNWIDTFADGLRAQFKEEIQEYFAVGFSQFTVRMFYNKTLFREILGRDDPPRSYRDLLDCCSQIKEYNRINGTQITPIASSKYQVDFFKYMFLSSMTADLVRRFDVDLDGWCSPEEELAAILTGDWSPMNEQYKAALQIVNNVADNFPQGFMALGRMDAGFSFVQGRSAMITSGSWDARSYLKKIQDQPEDKRFEVGIFDMPLVGKHDPEFGAYFDGRASEANTGTGFAFGITRFAKDRDLCIEFLQFCTTPENNTILNDYAQWIPSVRGAVASNMLKHFEPKYIGYWGQMSFYTGQHGAAVEKQTYWPYVSGQIDFKTYSERLLQKLPAAAAIDFSRNYKESREALPDRHARRSAYLALSVLGSEDQQRANKIKLLRAWDTLVHFELRQEVLDSLLKNTEDRIAKDAYQSDFNDIFYKHLKRELGN